jgi:Uma2 family endonuclease
MVKGDPIEEESMTAALRLAAPDLIGRHDLTVDDVANLPEDLRYELIDGRLVVSPTPKPIHQSVGVDVAAAFKVNRPPGVVVSTDQSVMFDGHNERCPDVALIEEEGADFTPVLASDVLLAVEIISPSSQVDDRVHKMRVYADGGIPIYWVIDLLAERVTLTEYLLGPDGKYRQQEKTDALMTMVRPWEVTLDPPAWTEERDRIRKARRSR